MTTISKLYDSAYSSGNVSLSLGAGDLAVICVHWTWNTSASYIYSSGAILVDGTDIGGVSYQLIADDSIRGDFMKIGTFLAPSAGSFNVSLNPTDTGTGRDVRLIVIKITPTASKKFNPSSYYVGSDTQPKETSGTKTLTIPNNIGDILVGIAGALNPDGTLRIAWSAPASEQTDLYVESYTEVTVATQVSESANDAFVYVMGAEYYNAAVGVAVRESDLINGVTAVFLSDYGVM